MKKTSVSPIGNSGEFLSILQGRNYREGLKGRYHARRLLGIMLLLLTLGACGNRVGPAPKNQAGTQSVIIPGYSSGTLSSGAGNIPGSFDAGSGELPAAEVVKTHGVLEKSSGFRDSDGIIEIKEKMFIAQTNDVYLNPEDYLGKTIKLEGLFKSEIGYENTYCFVIRYGPGCCGYDGNAGFEVVWDDPDKRKYPDEDAWVEAVGNLQSYDEDGYPYLYLALTSLTVKKTRGSEFVTQ
ncbi:MAG: hypothetical protein LBB78_02075 [Spirochaetaceae bacterium]|jgi:hypothetical protein|nr:hypothetical protein [Spirochaetaceae bacterium]